MGRSRAAWALIAVLISSALSDLAGGGDLVECEPQRVTGDGRHWAYRIVDSRECWYPGRPGKPKNELFWGRGATLSARQTVDQPQAETEAEPSAPPSHLAAAPSEKQRPPRQCRRNGAQPPPTSCSHSPAAGRSWWNPPRRRPGRWRCCRSGSTRFGGLPRQAEDHGLFVPEMLAE
jgi:hypothetical protein